MLTSRRSLYVGLSLVFAGHNAEEALFAPAMLGFLQTRAPAFLRDFYAGVSVAQLRTGLLLLSLLGVALSLFAVRSAAAASWSYTMLVFAGVIGLNAVGHLALALSTGEYMPGLGTALVLSLPSAALLFSRAWCERWVSAPALWSVPVVALFVHGPVLAALLRLVLARP